MSRTYSGSNNDRVLKLIQSCPLPDGATHAWLCEQTGISAVLMTKSLCYLAHQAKLIVLIKFGKWVKYFPSQEALDAAAPALEEFKRQLKERKRAMDKAARERWPEWRKEKVRKQRAARYKAKMAARPPKPPKEAKPKAPKPKKQRAYKPGPQIVYAKTVSAKPQPGGPARMPGEPVITPATKFTIAPPPPDRLYRTTTFSVLP